ncbi:MAG: UDP-N-acetylmuramoyl-L-alanine--D-glutamate ligase [Actinomycetota bacterium]
MSIENFLKNKSLMVIGLGKTGISVIKNIVTKTESVIAVDDNPNIALREDFSRYKNLNIALGKEAKNGHLLEEVDLIITSPGVPSSHYIIKKAAAVNIPIWSELELSWSLMDKKQKRKTIAVTGTNGKTTAVNLVGKIFKDAGFNTLVCGNVGNPLINTINMGDCFRIIEVSSFQLERINSFSPHIAVILNITSDHMDRHCSMRKYVNLKFNLLKFQTRNDFALLNYDDENIKGRIEKQSKKIKPEVIKFSLNSRTGPGIWLKSGIIYYKFKNLEGRIDTKGISLQGRHNISNILPCVGAAKLAGIEDENIGGSLKDFKPLGHRLEYLGKIRGIHVFNDSKSTNPDATVAALNNFGGNVTLILGGRDKNMDFSKLARILKKKVAHLILIGESKDRLFDLVSKSSFKIYKADTLENAVNIGFKETSEDGVFLLSPACASMDMFKNYKHRGNEFKQLVKLRAK